PVIEEKLSPTRFESLKIRVRHLDVASFLLSERSVALQIKCVPIPSWVLMRDVTKDAEVDRSRIRGAVKGRYRPIGLAAGHQARIDGSAVAFLRRRIRELHRLDLRAGEAIVSIAIAT